MSDNETPSGQPAGDADLPQIERDRQLIKDAEGTGGKLLAYTRLSGPGWLQSAITLGGGSLGGSLYLGVLAGYGAMFWQPLAMIMGVIMLSAIGYVALSTGERPFDAINKHVNPVLGWGWAIATLMANLVWCMPQYSLAKGALQQNLGIFPESPWPVVAILFVLTGIVIVCYDSGGAAVKVFDWVLKAMVGIVVISFFYVVLRMTMNGQLPWGRIFAGFVPDFSVLWSVSSAYDEVLKLTGEFRGHWESVIQNAQRDAMIASAATAVGINMTFLLPYSMLRKGWDRDFRGLAIFDLSTGLFVPYLVATSCVVIASAAAFHAKEAPGLVAELEGPKAAEKLVGAYEGLLDKRLAKEHDGYADLAADRKAELRAGLPIGDRRVAAMIVKRDNKQFAAALGQMSDKTTAHVVFGIGVLGMGVSTIIILMLINGFVLTEIFNRPKDKTLHLTGCFLASVFGAIGSQTIWSSKEAAAYLTIPTSMFGMVLLPIAYVTFLMLLNSKSLLGDDKPTGGALVRWNVLMGLATAFATFCCLWSINSSPNRLFGFGALGAFAVAAVVVHFLRSKPAND